jgi:hypothetical protein
MSKAEDTSRRENRFHVCLSDQELATVDDWRFANRVATRAEAVRRLIALGLPKMKEQTMFAKLKNSARRKEQP